MTEEKSTAEDERRKEKKKIRVTEWLEFNPKKTED